TYGPKTDAVCKSYAQFFEHRQSKHYKYASANSFEKWLKSRIRHDEVVSSIQNGRYIFEKYLWAQNGRRMQKLRSILRAPTVQAFRLCKCSFFRKMAEIPNTSRGSSEFNPKRSLHFRKLIDYYVREKYTLRYTGGMVPDVNQIIVKEKGIFTNVTSPTAKAKLRLLFEVAPLGFLIEKAGGYSSDGKQSVLDRVVTNLDDRTQVAYGSKNEIIRFEETLYGSSRLKVAEPVGATA
ncbi:sedoheptulose-1,7-bisphosphatase, chloroplastic, partial [Olea europaea subsp. europaea]